MSRFLTEHSSDLSERQMPATQPDAGTEHITTRHTSADIDSTADNPKIPGPGPSQTIDHMELGSGAQSLSDLLHDEQVTSEALVNHAIDWLLE
jgi:hypothetical protein